MLQPKAIVCLLLSISFAFIECADDGNFEDADRGGDFITSSFGDANGQWDLRNSIPGEPEVDYPIYSIVPKTSFSCEDRHEGYYADIETRCQVFRICTNTDLSGEGFAFLCPNGTLFSQRDFVCDWYRNVDCTESENYYFKNEDIGVNNDKDEMMKIVKEMVEFPMKTITKTIQKSTKSPTSTIRQKPALINQSNRDSNQNRNQGQSNKVQGSRVTNSNQKFQITVESDTNEEDQRTTNRNQPKQQQSQQKQQSKQQNQQPKQQKQQQQQQNQRQRSGQQNNGSRNQQNGRKNVIELKEKQRVTSTSNSRDRFESNESDRFNSPRIYVNSLGELSTDPGVNFDPRSSIVIEPDQTSRRGKNKNREQKKSLDDILGDSSSRNNYDNERREKLKQGLPGTDNKRVRVSTKVKSTFSKGDDGDDIPDRSSSASKTKLNFAEKINAGLNGFISPDSLEITGNSNGSNIPEFVRNFIDKKTPRKQGEPKIEQDDHDQFLNLADNVNGGFLTNDHGSSGRTHVHKEYHLDKTVSYQDYDNDDNERKSNRVPKVYRGEGVLSEPIQPTRKSQFSISSLVTIATPQAKTFTNHISNQTTNKTTVNTKNLNVGQSFQETKMATSTKSKNVDDEYRSGRQFQFFGSGFTKPGQTPVTLKPFNGKLDKSNSNNNYLPPSHVQPFVSQVQSHHDKSSQSHNRVSIQNSGVFTAHGSTQTKDEELKNLRQPKKQSVPSRFNPKGPNTLSVGASLPVQNLISTDEYKQAKNEISKLSTSSLATEPKKPSLYYLPPIEFSPRIEQQPEFSPRIEQPASNVPDLFLMVGDINAAEETKPSTSDLAEAIVKRRAQTLLVQGLQQAFFENEYNENEIEHLPVQVSTKPIVDPAVIDVNDEEQKDSDVTNIEKLLVGNIRNFLRTGVENEIKQNEILENVTSETSTKQTVVESQTGQTILPFLPTETNVVTISNSTIEDQTTDVNAKLETSTISTENNTSITTDIISTDATEDVNLETTTLNALTAETVTQTDETKSTTSSFAKVGRMSLRRLNVKSINYSKKPYTLRPITKSSTTTKANKYSNNIRRRPFNRLGLKDTANNETATTSTTTAPTGPTGDDDDDLQATANSYRSYHPTTTLSRLRVQNETASKSIKNHRFRSNNFLRNHNSSTTIKATTTTTTTVTPSVDIKATTISSQTTGSTLNTSSLSSFSSPSSSNLSITNLIPFDILSKAIHGNTDTTNLQNQKSQLQYNQQRNKTVIGTQQTIQTQPQPQPHPKALYTQIPGTNIKISKSNEEASFSFDPLSGLKPQPVSTSHQTGYVPLDQYITQTLSKTLLSPEYAGSGNLLSGSSTILPSSAQNNIIHPTIATLSQQQQHQQQNHQFSFTSSALSSNLPTFKPSNVNLFASSNNNNNNNNNNNIYQQQSSISIIPSIPTFISQPSQINNLQPPTNLINNLQQATQQNRQQSSLNLSNRGTFTTSLSLASNAGQQDQTIRQQELGGFLNNILQQEQQQQQFTKYQTLPTPSPTTSSFSFNQFGNLLPQPISLNSALQPNNNQQQTYEQFVQDQVQQGYPQGYPLTIFNEIPVAQRRFDLEENDIRNGKSIYDGVSSYHVPLGSVGRLAGDIAATKRLRRTESSRS